MLVRFRDDAQTLPAVLAALAAQTRAPDELVGVDTGSRDGSAELVRRAGGRLVSWRGRYDPGAVLNEGIARCRGERILVCSSHTVLEDPATLASLEACFDDARVSAASPAWDDHPEPGPRVDAESLRRAGLRPASPYTNSAGMVRRAAWERHPFPTGWPRAAEDYRWAVEEILAGGVIRRLPLPYRWLRGPKPWGESFRVAWLVFRVADEHGLPLAWKGVGGSTRALLRSLRAGRDARTRRSSTVHSARIAARACHALLPARSSRAAAHGSRAPGVPGSSRPVA